MTSAALIGFGLAGRFFHAPLAQAAGIEVGAVVTRQRHLVQDTLPRALVFDDMQTLFAGADVDVIVIATPNHLHAEQARSALLAGKHVVIDKPMCLSTHDADELLALAREKNRVLTVFQNRRWDADFLTIQRLLATHRLGELNAFHARWDRYRPDVVDRWREHGEGSGVLWDLGAHLIDQAVSLFGMPDWLQADVFSQRAGASAPDGFELLLGRGAARISLGVSTLAADGGPRYRVHGSRGSYVKSGLDIQEAQLRAGMLPNAAGFAVEPQQQWGVFTDGASGTRDPVPSERGRWTEFYSQLRASIEQGGPPPVAAIETRNIVRIIEAAIASSRTGRRHSL